MDGMMMTECRLKPGDKAWRQAETGVRQDAIWTIAVPLRMRVSCNETILHPTYAAEFDSQISIVEHIIILSLIGTK